jgi:zinc protease
MLKKVTLILLAGCLATAPLQAQTKLVEKVNKKGKEIVIPYQKYVLSNGLTLIVHEDHSDPIVHVDVTYHVGSGREEIGKSGFAHFFEHMMFQGSDNVGDEQHFKIVTESGGTLNGTTNRDRTNYFETLPNNQLETALWLEADRMGFLLDAVTQRKFEVQRETVKNERGQNYDNRPYGLAGEYVSKTLYPYGHPYSWLTIGYIEDLNRVDVNDLKNFFLRWYGPNNATLTVGGDVKPAEVVKLAEKYFGSIPKGPEVKSMKLALPVLENDRYVAFEDNIRMPMLRMVFPVAARFDKDEAALDCLADILGSGKNSILYKNFVKEQKAVQASAGNYTSELAGELTFSVVSYPGKPLKEAEDLIRASLEEFEKRGVSDDDVRKFIASYESSTIRGLGSVSGKVSQLASYQTFAKDPNYLTKELKAYTSLTKEDVMKAYNKYLKGKKAVILSVVPKGQMALAAGETNYTPSADGYKAPKDQYAGLTYNKAKDTFDRSQRPGSGPNPMVTVPDYWTTELNNGIKVIGTRSDEIPTVTMMLTIEGGHKLSAANPSKAGIASLTASMLNEDTEKYTSEEMSTELEKLGSTINIYSGSDNITIQVQSLVKNIDATLKLVEERMFKPRFAADDFERLKKQQLEGIANQNTQPTVVASKVYSKLLYGQDHIMAIPASGTAESVNNITLEDVKEFYARNFSPSVAKLVIVGDIDQKTMAPKLNFLTKWQPKPVEIPQFAATPAIEKTRIYMINKEKAAQSEIRIGYMALPYDATGEYYKNYLMNYTLGGAFNSRINLNLREDKGYTYGARSGFSGSKDPGPFTASAGVRANATDSSLVEFIKEITEFRDKGISADELTFLQSSIGQSDARNYETPFQKALFLNRLLEYNLSKDYVKQQSDILTSITTAELNALANKNLPIDKMHIVVVGDKQLIEPGLKNLGYEIIEMDADGNIIPTAQTTAPVEVPAQPKPVEKTTKTKRNRKG